MLNLKFTRCNQTIGMKICPVGEYMKYARSLTDAAIKAMQAMQKRFFYSNFFCQKSLLLGSHRLFHHCKIATLGQGRNFAGSQDCVPFQMFMLTAESEGRLCQNLSNISLATEFPFPKKNTF